MKLDLRTPRSLFMLLVVMMGVALVTACANTPKPVSTEDYVQSARAQVGAIYQTIGDLKAQRSITQAQSKSAIAKVEKLEAQADLADSLLVQGKPTDAQSTARLALAGLLALQAELPKPKGTSP